MLDLIRRYSALYLVEILGFCLMGNHFHILVRVFPEPQFTDEDILKRYVDFYGDARIFADGLVPSLRKKLSSLSEFMREINEFGVRDAEERLKHYRRYGYEAGAVNRSEKPTASVINNRVLAKERKDDFELKRVQRFRYRTRYFTDSGIIGSKEFVSTNYSRFKHLFMSKKNKIPKQVKGLDGIFSLKRFSGELNLLDKDFSESCLFLRVIFGTQNLPKCFKIDYRELCRAI